MVKGIVGEMGYYGPFDQKEFHHTYIIPSQAIIERGIYVGYPTPTFIYPQIAYSFMSAAKPMQAILRLPVLFILGVALLAVLVFVTEGVEGRMRNDV